jgi:hypothetical protein
LCEAGFNLASDNIQLRNEDPDSDINDGKVEKKPPKPTFGVLGASVPNVTHQNLKTTKLRDKVCGEGGRGGE